MKDENRAVETGSTAHEAPNPSGSSSPRNKDQRNVSDGESYWKKRHGKLAFDKMVWAMLFVAVIVCGGYFYARWQDWRQSDHHQTTLLDFLLSNLPESLFSSLEVDKPNQDTMAGEGSHDSVADALKAEVEQYLEKEAEPEDWQTWENGISALIERVRQYGDLDSVQRLTGKREKERNRISQLAQTKAEVKQYLEKEVEPEDWQTWENGISALIERVREYGDLDSVQRLTDKREKEQTRITQIAQKNIDHYWDLYVKTHNQEDLAEYERWRILYNDVLGCTFIAAPDPNAVDLHLLDAIVKQGDFDASRESLKDYLQRKIDLVENYLLYSKGVGNSTRQTLQQTTAMARKLIHANTYTITVELTGGWDHAFDVYIWGIWFSTQGKGAQDEANDAVQEWSDRANRFIMSHSTQWVAGQPLRLSVYRNDYLMAKQRIGSFYYDDYLAIKHFCKKTDVHFTPGTVRKKQIVDTHSPKDFYAMEYKFTLSCEGEEWGDEELALIQNVETYLISSNYWRELLQHACERKVPHGAW